MSNFFFPPPPPPPPRAAPEPDFDGLVYLRGGRGRGGPQSSEFRGRGRGRANYQTNLHRGGSSIRGSKSNDSYANGSNSIPVAHGIWSDAYHGRDSGLSSFSGGEAANNRGQKRKRDDYFSKPKASAIRGPDIAPAVPIFGSLVSPVEAASSPSGSRSTPQPAAVNAVPTKRKVNQLGLTPQDYNSSESENDDENEEAALAAALHDPLQISYGGTTMSLNSREAMRAWIADRRKNWPTTARINARKQEELKAQQESLRRKLEESRARKQAQASMEKPVAARHSEQHNVSQLKLSKVEKLRQKLAKAEAAAAAQTSKADRKGANQEQDRAAVHTSDLVDQEYGDSSPDANSHHDADDSGIETSSSDSASDDDHEAPESIPTARERMQMVSPLPAANPQRSSQSNSQRRPAGVCHAFASKGYCHSGKACRYKHERPERPAKKAGLQVGKRISLYQRFVEQELQSDDRQMLSAIKYLGQSGYLD